MVVNSMTPRRHTWLGHLWTKWKWNMARVSLIYLLFEGDFPWNMVNNPECIHRFLWSMVLITSCRGRCRAPGCFVVFLCVFYGYFFDDGMGWGGAGWDVKVHVTLMVLRWSWGGVGWDVNYQRRSLLVTHSYLLFWLLLLLQVLYYYVCCLLNIIATYH